MGGIISSEAVGLRRLILMTFNALGAVMVQVGR